MQKCSRVWLGAVPIAFSTAFLQYSLIDISLKAFSTAAPHLSILPVKGTPHLGPRVGWHLDAQLDVVRENEGAEGQAVRADGCEEDAWDLGVDHGAPRGQVVCSGASGGRDNEAVALFYIEEW